MEMNNELLAKAKKAKTLEELMTIGKENGTELNEESAKAYFDLLQPKNGELSDEELDNVSGGGCYNGDRLIVTIRNRCNYWVCKTDGESYMDSWAGGICKKCGCASVCENCKYCSYEKGLWLCNNTKNRTPEELLAIAKENGTELNEESAKSYVEWLQPKNGELSDDELDNVSGGCNNSDGREIGSAFYICDKYVCSKCGGGCVVSTLKNAYCKECGRLANCTNCKNCSYEKGLWLCNY